MDRFWFEIFHIENGILPPCMTCIKCGQTFEDPKKNSRMRDFINHLRYKHGITQLDFPQYKYLKQKYDIDIVNWVATCKKCKELKRIYTNIQILEKHLRTCQPDDRSRYVKICIYIHMYDYYI